MLALAIVPVVLYQLLGQKWIALPWSLAVLLGTATSFIVGFKNAQTYNRTVEAQQVWTAIASASRYWGTISRDFPTNPRSTKILIRRHLAWLTVLRYQLREHRVWESVTSSANAEYREKFYSIPETESPLEVELAKYLPEDEFAQVTAMKSKGVWLISAQSRTIRDLFANQELAVLHHTEMQKTLKDLLDQQSKAERIKNFPYPTVRDDQYDLHLVLRRLAALLRHQGIRSAERRRLGTPRGPDGMARDSVQRAGVLDVRVSRPGR